MRPGFSPLGPGSRRMVERTSGMRAARRRSIIWRLASAWMWAPPRFAAALALAGGGAGGGLLTKALGALGSPPGTSASLEVPAQRVSAALMLETLRRPGRS